ncbi:MAG: DUF1080 domain-containing protein [Anaerolineae bacterium]|nr:DUF1080 domain-containing protein [Anaerolineae bacterium]
MRNLRVCLLLLLVLMVSACLPRRIPGGAAPEVSLQQQVLASTFDQPEGWQTINDPGVYLQVEDGVYRTIFSLPGRFGIGLHNNSYRDTVIEAKVAFTSAYNNAIVGLMCRANPVLYGYGYYFLISGDGAFSIRRGDADGVVALVPWQNGAKLNPNGQRNTLRVVCADDSLALYVNGEYMGSAQDATYQEGHTGIVVGLPVDVTEEAIVSVEYDDLLVWLATRN